MSYKVLNDPTHRCELPEAGDFPLHTRIECTDPVLRNGYEERCGSEWRRIEKGRRKEAEWQRVIIDYAW